MTPSIPQSEFECECRTLFPERDLRWIILTTPLAFLLVLALDFVGLWVFGNIREFRPGSECMWEVLAAILFTTGLAMGLVGVFSYAAAQEGEFQEMEIVAIFVGTCLFLVAIVHTPLLCWFHKRQLRSRYVRIY